MLGTISAAGLRVADVVDNMLSFARKGDTQVSSHQLKKVLDKTIELAATDYDLKKQYDFKRIKIEKAYAEHMPAVPCQEGKIQQVLLNILSNGAQAMQTSLIENPQFIIRAYVDPYRNMACMEIEDNGPGMDEATRKKVFDPFFTTKPKGLGTGLGLSVSYFIITENHNGEIEVESRPGAGAKFIIRLPVI
jgi:signal transduction histidine kinase